MRVCGEVSDGAEQAYAANLIVENLYSQVDHEGHHFTLMKEIIDHDVSESALPRDQSQVRDQPEWTLMSEEDHQGMEDVG
jgi:hypothetical protein